jgi:hypothetical protein
MIGASASVLPPGAPGHPLWTAATGVVPAFAQTDSQTAIQQVVQRANDEQSQAVSTGNPSVMSDTATPAYYRQLLQANQQMAAGGVTSLTLNQLTWGPITVNGTTATATTDETWIITFSDSTTGQSQDTNVYTLVQQGGTWLIESDQIPAAASGQPGSGTGGPAPVQPAPAPADPTGQGTSHNWSGYATTGGSYTSVTGTWTVPQPAANGVPGVGATWVGIGGVSSNDLIQAGTQQTVTGTGQTQYQSWVETLPQASHPVPLTVSPGDSVTVAIDQLPQAADQWQISFKNNTTGQTFQVTEHYTSSLSSAEWIEEAPSGMRGRQFPLDDFGTVTFTDTSAVKDGKTVNVSQSGAQGITMATRGQTLAQPSAIDASGAGFSVARTNATSTSAAQGQAPASQGQSPATPLSPGGRGRFS